MGLKATMELLLGNINGHFSYNLSFIPTIIIGEFDMMNTYFGAGFSMQDLDKKNTGIGLTSIFGGSFYILRNLGIDFSFGYYDFGKYSFNSIKIGIDWIAD
jgi:hypothetical protein